MSTEIMLTRGQVAIVDDQDAELSRHHWHATRHPDSSWYARRNVPGQHGKMVLLHREIAKRAGLDIDGKEVDHWDGNGLNNRRANLRVATRVQNAKNMPKPRRNKSGFKGVSFYARDGRWQAHIKADGVNHYLGRFDTPEEAAVAYEEAAKRLHGEFARTA